MKRLLCLLTIAIAQMAFAESREPSVVLIMVDGLRPDVVRYHAEKGDLPFIKQYFMDEGTQFPEAYTMLPLTVPSWSALLTGRDLHHTGLKGNDFFDRETKKVTNLLDWRQDFLSSQYLRHGRAYRYVRKSGAPLIMDFFNRGQAVDAEGMKIDDEASRGEAFMTFFPLNDAFPKYNNLEFLSRFLPIEDVKKTGVRSALVRFFFDEHKGFEAIDADSVDRFKKILADSSAKRKLIGIYFSNGDHAFHENHDFGVRMLKQIDYRIGEIMLALQSSRYSQSVVALVSDHGQIGGKEVASESCSNPLCGENVPLTMTNLSQYLGGYYSYTPSGAMCSPYEDYQFNVESAFVSEGKYSLRNYSEFFLNRYQCTNVSKVAQDNGEVTCQQFAEDHPELIQAAVSTSQSIALPYASSESQDWATPNNWYTLTHYQIRSAKTQGPVVKNLIKDLENFRVNHLNLRGQDLSGKRRLEQKIGLKPLDWLALTVTAADFNSSIEEGSGGPKALGAVTHDVVLIHKSDQEQALILTGDEGGGEVYRYQPIRAFTQAQSGRVEFEISRQGADPLQYRAIAELPKAYWPARFWLKTFAKSAYPQAVPALSRLFRFEGGAKTQKAQFRFDLFLNPKYGHLFTPDNTVMEAAHGMLQKESSRFLFMIRGPGIRKGYLSSTPVMSVDFLPTVLSAGKRQNTGAFLADEAPPLDQLDGEVLEEAFGD